MELRVLGGFRAFGTRGYKIFLPWPRKGDAGRDRGGSCLCRLVQGLGAAQGHRKGTFRLWAKMRWGLNKVSRKIEPGRIWKSVALKGPGQDLLWGPGASHRNRFHLAWLLHQKLSQHPVPPARPHPRRLWFNKFASQGCWHPRGTAPYPLLLATLLIVFRVPSDPVFPDVWHV